MNSCCWAGENRLQLRASTRRLRVSKSMLRSTMARTLSRRSCLLRSFSASTASTSSDVLCTTSRGLCSAATGVTNPTIRSALAIARACTRRSRHGVEFFVLIARDSLGRDVFGAVLDQGLAPLQVSIADERVVVERGGLRFLDGLQELRSGVDDVADAGADQDPAVDEERRDGGRRVDGERRRVAHAGGAQHGQHEVGPWRHAPDAERLAEILVVWLEAELARRVEEAAETQDRVDGEAADGLGAVDRLALQQVVEQVHREPQVAEEVRDAILHRLRSHRMPAGGA